MEWKFTKDDVLCNTIELPLSGKIISMDLDHTLIKTKSGRKFPKSWEDWIIYDTKLFNRLNNFTTLVIITNQSGKITNDDLIKKFNNIIQYLQNKTNLKYIYVLASRKNNYFRKPLPGMFEMIKPDTKITYVGDAAGRINDFSCSDRKFAHNTGMDFLTPEEFIQGKKLNKPFIWGFIPPPLDSFSPKEFTFSKNKCMIIFTGYPASGKSTFYKTHLSNLKLINMDTLKSSEKCLKMTKKYLENNSVVVDNTNPSIQCRNKYIKIAQEQNVPVISIYFTMNYDFAQYMSGIRQIMSKGKKKAIPSLVYNIYRKKFVKPTMAEGFSDIVEINPEDVLDPKVLEEYWNYRF